MIKWAFILPDLGQGGSDNGTNPRPAMQGNKAQSEFKIKKKSKVLQWQESWRQVVKLSS